MFSSIQNRLKLILGVNIIFGLLMGGITFFFFAQISEDIELVIGTDIKLERIGYKLKPLSSVLSRDHNMYLNLLNKNPELEDIAAKVLKEDVKKSLDAIEENLGFKIAKENEKLINNLKSKLLEYIKIVEAINMKRKLGEKVNAKVQKSQLNVLVTLQQKMIDQLISVRSKRFVEHQSKIKDLLSNSERIIVLVISLSLVGISLILLLAPQKVVRPIKSYVNAIKELRELKFDVRLPVNQDNELAELGKEINAFIEAFTKFDEMKVKKIQFEKRRLQFLTTMLNLGVVILSKEGNILFMNAQMASFLKLSSEDFHKKDFHFVRLQDELKELFEDAIAKNEKFENRMIVVTYEKENSDGEKHEEAVELLVDAGVVRNHAGDVVNVILTFEDISCPKEDPSSSVFHRLSFYHKEQLGNA